MNLLALETSTNRGGVAFFKGGNLEFIESTLEGAQVSTQLFDLVQSGLKSPPSHIAVGLGPGSYAGVRIAIATAIGLSVATGAELLGVPSIAALGRGEYIAVGDARRGGFSFAQVSEGELAKGPLILTREQLEAELAAATLPVYSSEQLGLPGIQLRFPSVEILARLALGGVGIIARGNLEPLYLRDPHITTPKTAPHAA